MSDSGILYTPSSSEDEVGQVPGVEEEPYSYYTSGEVDALQDEPPLPDEPTGDGQEDEPQESKPLAGGDLYDTLERRPNTQLYRKQATGVVAVSQLFNEDDKEQAAAAEDGAAPGDAEEGGEKPQGEAVKFGTWDGVFIRVVLNIWGVIMFLRLGWVVGNAGVFLAACIILLAVLVTLLTTISLSAICTNGDVGGGGAYFLISRALGAEWGGAIGILFSLANAVAIALYVVGFAEALNNLVAPAFHISGTDQDINDVRVYGIIVLVLLLCICLIGVAWEAAMQKVLLAVLLLALISFFLGVFFFPDAKTGFVGIGKVGNNFKPAFGEGENFFTVFGVFFPAATGIMAGANISGDLKDPSVNIPLGTLVAIALTSSVYVFMAVCLGISVENSALVENYLIATDVAAFGPLIYAGIFAATLSSALASLVGAPRIFQAVCADGIFPKLAFFGKGHGPGNDPRRGYFLAFVIAGGCIAIGELNIIARVISQFFLISYCFINFACFAASMSRSPGWRPQFRYYNPFIALAGGLGCLVVMFLIDWLSALIAMVVMAGLYQYLVFFPPDVNWGTAREAREFVVARDRMMNLNQQKEHVKLFRPQFLFLRAPPPPGGNMAFANNIHDTPILRFLGMLSEAEGSLIVSTVLVRDRLAADEIQKQREDTFEAMATLGVPGFSEAVVSESLRNGARNTMILAGLSKIKPNILALGFKGSRSSSEEYVNIIRDAFELDMGVVVIRNAAMVDSSKRPRKANIDIWWLMEDGGLTVLAAHVLKKHKYWSDCNLRVLYEKPPDAAGEEKEEQIVKLLSLFRINGEPVAINAPAKLQPTASSLERKTANYARLGNVIAQQSSLAKCVFVTIPKPRDVPAEVYLGWLDSLSICAQCPTVLIRGTQVVMTNQNN